MVTPTAWELDEPTVVWIGRDLGVEVGPGVGWDTPQWQVTMHGPGGTYVVESSDHLSVVYERATQVAGVLGGWGHPRWEHNGTWWKAARAREMRYSEAKRRCQAEGLDYHETAARAAEEAEYPNARNARHNAGRFGKS